MNKIIGSQFVGIFILICAFGFSSVVFFSLFQNKFFPFNLCFMHDRISLSLCHTETILFVSWFFESFMNFMCNTNKLRSTKTKQKTQRIVRSNWENTLLQDQTNKKGQLNRRSSIFNHCTGCQYVLIRE